MLSSSLSAQKLFDRQENLIKSGKGLVMSERAIAQATQTMSIKAKAATFALNTLKNVGNMIVFTLISAGISKLMNIETEALEKAQDSYEKAIEQVDKLQEREDLAFASANELSEVLSSEDWGLESAQKASDIYSEMADKLEEIGGAEDSRIEQLRSEARQIRENIGLSKEERLAKAEALQRDAISGWNQSSVTDTENATKAAQDQFWVKIEKDFFLIIGFFIFADTFNLFGIKY